MLATVEHLSTRTDVSEVVALLDGLPSNRRLDAVLEILSLLFTGSAPAAYAELWGASRSQPDLVDALHQADEVSRENIRALFGAELLEHAGDGFDALLDLTLYALRGMALDAHVATEDEESARKQIILGLKPYFEQELR